MVTVLATVAVTAARQDSARIAHGRAAEEDAQQRAQPAAHVELPETMLEQALLRVRVVFWVLASLGWRGCAV